MVSSRGDGLDGAEFGGGFVAGVLPVAVPGEEDSAVVGGF
jgi:hypothetical protein